MLPAPCSLKIRWLIVEDALRDRKGHWFEYLGTFARELRALGDDVTILADRSIEPPLIKQLQAQPVLPASIWHRMSDGSSALRRYLRVPAHAWKTYRAMKAYLRRGQQFDIIFVPTVIVHHLLGWTWLIKRELKKMPVRVLLFFPNTPVQLDLKTNEISWQRVPTARLFCQLIRSLQNEVKQGRVILGTETHPMREALTRLTGVPFTYFPHPVCCEGAGSREQGATLTFASYGSARHEKGSDVLVAAVDEFCRRYPDSRAQFVLQCVGGDAKLWARLKGNPRVHLIPGHFAEGEYARHLAQTDVMLLPYRRSSYGLRVSRVVIEAMVHGIPVVATRQTTLEDQAKEYGAAILCEDENVESLVAAMEAAEHNYESLAAKAGERTMLAREHFSIGHFRGLLAINASGFANQKQLYERAQLPTIKRMAEVKPKILIVALETWPAMARLPKALQRAGFEVAAFCQRDSYLASTRYLDRLFPCDSRRRGSSISRQFTKIVQDWNPRVIVPGDERTIQLFQRMVQLHDEGKRPLPSGVLESMRFSFGNFNWQSEATSKRLTLRRASELGLRTPRFARPASLEQAISQAAGFGWPVVLKKSTGYGGGGVTFCEDERQLAVVYQKYNEATNWKGNFKSYFIQARGWSLGRDWCPVDHSFTVNEAIRGVPAAIAVAAASGNVLAHTAALKVKCHPAIKGPASVMQLINLPGMFQAVEKLIRHWGATGFLGFDFIVADDGVAYLLESNPRPTPLSYMGELSGCDLCLVFHHYLEGHEIPAPSAPRHEFVAHFPNEWRRDPHSSYLHEAYHDVPWDDPLLFRKLVADFR